MDQHVTAVSRRDLLKLAGAAVAAGTAGGSIDVLRPGLSAAQTPRRGGVFRFPGFDPPHFDPHQTPQWWTFIFLSLTHGGLVRHKAGPSVVPGTLPIEPHLAESWEQPNDTTYIFKLRKGVRWHAKPPVNGRELTADDVVFTFQRALTIKGNPIRAAFEEIDRVEALDRYTVRFTMKEPFAWFLQSPALAAILPREAADKDGMFKKPETVIGTGPWMLERYEPNVRLTFVRNPHYLQPGLPYVDAIEARIDTDPASKLAAWLSGQYDFAPEIHMTVQRTDLDVVKRHKPNLQMAEFTWLISTFAAPKLEVAPFGDVRVRRALHMAVNGTEVIAVNPMGQGHGALQPDRPRRAARVGHPDRPAPPGGPAAIRGEPGGGETSARPGRAERAQVPRRVHRQLGPRLLRRRPGHPEPVEEGRHRDRAQAEGRERLPRQQHGSQLREDDHHATRRGDHARPLSGEPPAGRALNSAGVNDPKLNEMILLQRRTFDESKRREIIFDLQPYFSQQAYQLFVSPAAKVISAWEPYVKNFMPNIGNDYGGRLMSAWLDR